MTFDSLQYAMAEISRRLAVVEEQQASARRAAGEHVAYMRYLDGRIASLEAWQAYFLRLARNCFYIMAPTVLVVLNVAPREVIAAITRFTEALLP